MKVSEFDRQIVMPLMFFVVVTAIIFVICLIAIRKKGRFPNFRETDDMGQKKIQLKELAIATHCFFLPVGGLAASYFLNCSFEGKIIWPFGSFFVSVIFSCLVVRWLKRKGKIIQ
jgi:hypothetical protein